MTKPAFRRIKSMQSLWSWFQAARPRPHVLCLIPHTIPLSLGMDWAVCMPRFKVQFERAKSNAQRRAFPFDKFLIFKLKHTRCMAQRVRVLQTYFDAPHILNYEANDKKKLWRGRMEEGWNDLEKLTAFFLIGVRNMLVSVIITVPSVFHCSCCKQCARGVYINWCWWIREQVMEAIATRPERLVSSRVRITPPPGFPLRRHPCLFNWFNLRPVVRGNATEERAAAAVQGRRSWCTFLGLWVIWGSSVSGPTDPGLNMQLFATSDCS